MEQRLRPYERAVYWLGLGGGVALIGATILSVGLVQWGSNQSVSVWANRWFDVGLVIVGMGGLMLLWSLRLYLKHRGEQTMGSKPPDDKTPPSTDVNTGGGDVGSVGQSGGKTVINKFSRRGGPAAVGLYGNFSNTTVRGVYSHGMPALNAEGEFHDSHFSELHSWDQSGRPASPPSPQRPPNQTRERNRRKKRRKGL
jgi:hypothetical protein